MKTKKIFRALPILALSLVVLGGVVAVAQRKFMALRLARPDVKVHLSGSIERDRVRFPVQDVKLVKSGEVIDWIIASVNEGNAPAHDYKVIGAIPPGMQLVAGSVSADRSVSVTYSIDHGKSFSSQPVIEEKQADGSIKRVPAPVSMYTQIRYEWVDPLNQGAKLNASYKVRLN